jgi:hypothetical protein
MSVEVFALVLLGDFYTSITPGWNVTDVAVAPFRYTPIVSTPSAVSGARKSKNRMISAVAVGIDELKVP